MLDSSSAGSEVTGQVEYRVAPTIYYRSGGRQCTDMTLKAAMERAEELELEYLVVASTTGFTAHRALEIKESCGWGGKLVVVSEHTGYHAPESQPFSHADREFFAKVGIPVVTATHAFSSISRSFRLRWQGIDMAETVAESFRRFSRGAKVCLEICVMAADGGCIPTDRDVAAVGGSSRGCDTALVVRPTNMNRFFDLKVREVIAMPRLRDEEGERG